MTGMVEVCTLYPYLSLRIYKIVRNYIVVFHHFFQEQHEF